MKRIGSEINSPHQKRISEASWIQRLFLFIFKPRWTYPISALSPFYFFLAVVLLTSLGVTRTEAVSINARVYPKIIAPDQSVRLIISVSTSNEEVASELELPDLSHWRVEGQDQSSSTQSIMTGGSGGFKTEHHHQTNYQFILSPKLKGPLEIPPFSVTVNGTKYSSPPLKVLVETNPGRSGAPKGLHPPSPEDLDDSEDSSLDPMGPMGMDDDIGSIMGQMMGRLRQGQGLHPGKGNRGGRGGGNPDQDAEAENEGESAPPTPIKNKDLLFIKADIDKTEVFENEQITGNWYLYTRGNILQLERTKFPDFKGFWKEVIQEVPTLNFSLENIKGVTYRKALMATHALFPMKSGLLSIDGYTIKAKVQDSSLGLGLNSFFGQGFFGGGSLGSGPPRSVEALSPPIQILVKPLPTKDRPPHFTGAVGFFDVQSFVEGKNFPVDQPFTFKVQFEGIGNAKAIELPQLNLNPESGLEVYDTRTDSKFFPNGRSLKVFEYLIIPRKSGEVVLPTQEVSIFDPEKKIYYTKSTQEVKILVGNGGSGTPGATTNSSSPAAKDSSPSSPSPGANSSSTKNSLTAPKSIIGSDGISPWVALINSVDLSLEMAWFLVLSILGGTGLGIFGFTILSRRRGGGPLNLKTEIEARYEKRVEPFVSNKDWKRASIEMTNLIYYILGSFSGEGGANDEVKRLLEKAPPSWRKEYGGEISHWIEVFQILGFAPQEVVESLPEAQNPLETFQNARAFLIRSLL